MTEDQLTGLAKITRSIVGVLKRSTKPDHNIPLPANYDLEEGQKYKTGDIVRYVGPTEGRMIGNRRPEQGELFTVKEHLTERNPGGKNLYTLVEVRGFRMVLQQFEMYKRKDLEFCLGDTVENEEGIQGEIVGIDYTPQFPLLVKYEEEPERTAPEDIQVVRMDKQRLDNEQTAPEMQQKLLYPDEITYAEVPKRRRRRRRDTTL